MWVFRQILDFLRFTLFVRTAAHLHTPYLRDLLMVAFDASRRYYSFEDIESVRDDLRGMDTVIQPVDYGAGSNRGGGSKPRKLKSIINQAVSPASKCQIFFRLAVEHRASNILELGTSAGICTAYLASVSRKRYCHHARGEPATVQCSRNRVSSFAIGKRCTGGRSV